MNLTLQAADAATNSGAAAFQNLFPGLVGAWLGLIILVLLLLNAIMWFFMPILIYVIGRRVLSLLDVAQRLDQRLAAVEVNTRLMHSDAPPTEPLQPAPGWSHAGPAPEAVLQEQPDPTPA